VIDRRAELLCRQLAEGETALHHHEMAAAVADGEVNRRRPKLRRAIDRLGPIKHGVAAWAARWTYPGNLCHTALTRRVARP